MWSWVLKFHSHGGTRRGRWREKELIFCKTSWVFYTAKSKLSQENFNNLGVLGAFHVKWNRKWRENPPHFYQKCLQKESDMRKSPSFLQPNQFVRLIFEKKKEESLKKKTHRWISSSKRYSWRPRYQGAWWGTWAPQIKDRCWKPRSQSIKLWKR